METLRTPEERFEGLAGWEHGPSYVDVPDGEGGTLRIAHVDSGPSDADPVLLLHGEPSWSFLYRKTIEVLNDAGHRTVAPDLVGFGRSDKPAARTDYTYQRHMDWLGAWLDEVGLQRITLVCQDWGGLLGLRTAAEQPDRFARIVAANTMLPTGAHDPGDAFRGWQDFSQTVDPFPVGMIVNSGCVSDLSPEVIAAYDAPFPEERYKEGARQFPMLVPTAPDDPAASANRRAWEVLEQWDKPFLTAFSDGDPITRGSEAVLRSRIPGAQEMPHTTIEGAGHFLQEDQGERLGEVVASFVETTG